MRITFFYNIIANWYLDIWIFVLRGLLIIGEKPADIYKSVFVSYFLPTHMVSKRDLDHIILNYKQYVIVIFCAKPHEHSITFTKTYFYIFNEPDKL